MYIQQHRKKQSRYFWKNYPIYQADILAASQKKKKKADSITGIYNGKFKSNHFFYLGMFD